ncbi:hypothetical protein pmac_cds_206 [Pandoravirus macleodensis]|uniref:Uncharacterized protein n=1 Tax=Pandoravirus macleodensis TaxID=2107707 RepID=A0A2U7UEN7_9VIRU|nr:hypothetical protein pmac_cds_206 [Pandoravirus macleodensis]AVK76894.1 hypothetical protein pmac_cds_206 [Pandoravirus macleodensis]UMO79500.1 hypothetical protein [Pandoravirus aubagnensis]
MNALGRRAAPTGAAIGKRCEPHTASAPTLTTTTTTTSKDATRFKIALACAAGIVLLVTTLALIGRALERRDARNRYPPALVDRFRSLVRHASQKSVVAAQDQNPVVALLHANSALEYARVARTLLPAAEAERIVAVDLDELVLMLEDQQLDAMQRIHAVCPALQPDGVAAVATGWLG